MQKIKRVLFPLSIIIVLLSCTTSGKKKAVPVSETTSIIQTDQDMDSTAKKPKTKIEGIDISHHQSVVSWDSLKQTEIKFVFIKATGGLDYTDPEFHNNWKNAKQSGFLRGAYHFYYSVDDPAQQAGFFKETVLNVSDSLDLPPVLDIETHGVNSNISISQYQADVKKWLELTAVAFNKKPIIYTSKNFANKYLKDSIFSTYHLWLAEYEVEAPTVPETWETVGCTFWQNSYSDTIPGIKNQVDHNIFVGTTEELQHLGDDHQ